MATKEKVKLSPDVFDALELSALAYGGIGSGCLHQTVVDTEEVSCGISAPPSCIMGHAMFLDGLVLGAEGEGSVALSLHPVCAELIRAFPALVEAVSDEEIRNEAKELGGVFGVEEINDRLVEQASIGKTVPAVTFKKWCQLMNVVRGDQ